MKASAWLVLEVVDPYNWTSNPAHREVRITKLRQRRPVGEMAVKVVLDVDPLALQPHIEAMVEAAQVSMYVETQDDDA